MVGLLMPLKDRLKQLRKAAGLTQQSLAMKTGLSVSAVVQIENGTIPDPRLSTVRALARGLGVRLDELGANDEDETPPGTAKPEPEQPSAEVPEPRRGRPPKTVGGDEPDPPPEPKRPGRKPKGE